MKQLILTLPFLLLLTGCYSTAANEDGDIVRTNKLTGEMYIVVGKGVLVKLRTQEEMLKGSETPEQIERAKQKRRELEEREKAIDWKSMKAESYMYSNFNNNDYKTNIPGVVISDVKCLRTSSISLDVINRSSKHIKGTLYVRVFSRRDKNILFGRGNTPISYGPKTGGSESIHGLGVECISPSSASLYELLKFAIVEDSPE